MLLLVLLASAFKLSEACMAFFKGNFSSRHDLRATFITKTSYFWERHLRKFSDVNALEFFESKYGVFRFKDFVGALEVNDPVALRVFEEADFRTKYAQNSLYSAISNSKFNAFMMLADLLKPLGTLTVNLENYIKQISGWENNEILLNMLKFVSSSSGVSMDEKSLLLETSSSKIYLLNQTKHYRLKELKAAYASKQFPFIESDVVIRAIVENNLQLLIDILDDNFDPNTTFSLPEGAGSSWNNPFIAVDAELRKLIGTKKITALMFSFLVGRAAAAKILTERPETIVTFSSHEGLNALEIYRRLPAHKQAVVNTALQIKNHPIDLALVNGMMGPYAGESFIDVILKRRPASCIEAYFWKGLDYYSMDVVLAAVYSMNLEALQMFEDMGWLKFDELDAATASLIFETLLLLPPKKFTFMVEKLVLMGFDFAFGGTLVNNMYAPSVFDFIFSKQMSHAQLTAWLNLLQSKETGPKLPAMPKDYLIFFALETFNQKLLDTQWESFLGYRNPLTDEIFAFHFMRVYYPPTRDIDFIVENVALFDLRQIGKTVRPIIQAQSFISIFYYSHDLLIGWFKKAFMKATYCGVYYRNLTRIEKDQNCTLEDLCLAMEEHYDLRQCFKLTPRRFAHTELDLFVAAGIGSSPRADIDVSDKDYFVWTFHSSLALKNFPGQVGLHKESVEDKYGIGKEGNSVFHILVSPRAAHIDESKLIELIEYFAKTRHFYVDFISLGGEPITYTDAKGNIITTSTKGWTAFMVAMAGKKYRLADELVKYNANVYASALIGPCFAREYLEFKSQLKK